LKEFASETNPERGFALASGHSMVNALGFLMAGSKALCGEAAVRAARIRAQGGVSARAGEDRAGGEH